MAAIASPVTAGAFRTRAWPGSRRAGASRSFAGVALLGSALVHAAAFVAFGPYVPGGSRAPSVPEGPRIVHVALAAPPAEVRAPSVEPAASPPAGPPAAGPSRAASMREAPAIREAVADRVEGVAASATSTADGSSAPAPEALAVAIAPAPPAARPPASVVLVPAAFLHTPEPAYPASAREEGEEGVVLLKVRISRGGLPEEIVLERSSGHGALDRAAIAGVKRWSFTPARRDDEAIEAWMQIPIRFRLDS
jgi:protein TonB